MEVIKSAVLYYKLVTKKYANHYIWFFLPVESQVEIQIFPTEWKMGKALTIHRWNDKQNPKSYRTALRLQLLPITHDVYKSLDQSFEVRDVFLDTSKVFDKI